MTRSVLGVSALLALALSSGAAMACGGHVVQAPAPTTLASVEDGSSNQTPIVIPGKDG